MKKRNIILLLVTLVVVIAASAAVAVVFASADENAVIYVHFYNGANEYDYAEWEGKTNLQWGAYYWIDTGRVSVNYTTEGEPAEDPDEGGFSRKMLDESVNHGRCFEIKLNASETKAVQQGKKLGLIMVRCYKDELGYWTPYWNSNKGKDLSSDRYLDVKFSDGAYHVWIIAGDKNNYTSLRSAKSAFERIETANFDNFDTLILQTTKPINTTTSINLYKVTDAVEEEEVLVKSDLHVSETWNGGLNGKITGLNMADGFDWGADYQVEITDVSIFRTSATKTRLYLSQKFQNECVPDSSIELGAIYTPEATTFRLWAPISTNVAVNFYRTGNELDLQLAHAQEAMTRKDKGVWELTMQGDFNGVYYTYQNYVAGESVETVDVYATAVGVNGNRSMVCDLALTDPDGWDTDLTNAQTIRENKSETGVIWEVHVRDFSISPDSGLTYKGKYLAFTEQDTVVKGENPADAGALKSGIAYLKDLGVSYVHLNPVFDFATVDEEYINNTDYTTKQNWGYDPKNYNVPEGSYATDADHGEVRINEFKQMVQALHEAGIGVIMDVVYNHTATADSYLEKSVPGYYYRQALAAESDEWGRKWTTNALGAYNLSDGSGCSNETASERAMFRKYMVDSIVYWASEYHIDGFRFDLMAIHDVTTMQQIRMALNALPEGGMGILLYGEPWAAAELGLDKGVSADLGSLGMQEMLGIRAFNPEMREGIKGDNGWGDRAPSRGYVQGNTDENTMNRVMAGINGYFSGNSGAGNNHAITYTTSHDNYTLWDQLIVTTVSDRSPTIYNEPNAVLVRKNMMAATLTLTSRGMGFMLAGEELARTKYGNHNSYNAQDKINAIDYNRQKEFGALHDWYKGLIKLRSEFRGIAKSGGARKVYVAEENCICYLFDGISGDPYRCVYVLLNPNSGARTLSLEGSWQVLADGDGFHYGNRQNRSGSVEIPAYGTYILVLE